MTRDRMILLLQAEYETRRVHNLAVYEERVNETCDACPGLRTLIDRRRSVLMEGIRSAFYPEEGGVGAAAGVTNATHLERMNDQIKVLLHKNGLSRRRWTRSIPARAAATRAMCTMRQTTAVCAIASKPSSTAACSASWALRATIRLKTSIPTCSTRTHPRP